VNNTTAIDHTTLRYLQEGRTFLKTLEEGQLSELPIEVRIQGTSRASQQGVFKLSDEERRQLRSLLHKVHQRNAQEARDAVVANFDDFLKEDSHE